MVARPVDTGRFKQFRKGLAQLDEEGVVQVLRDPDLGDTAPVLAAVGRMQFEVFSHRKAYLARAHRVDPKMVYPPYSPMTKRVMRKIF